MKEEELQTSEAVNELVDHIKTISIKWVVLLILFAILGSLLGYYFGARNCENFYIPLLNECNNFIPLIR